jgi:hypothetical protein
MGVPQHTDEMTWRCVAISGLKPFDTIFDRYDPPFPKITKFLQKQIQIQTLGKISETEGRIQNAHDLRVKLRAVWRAKIVRFRGPLLKEF